MQKKKVFLLALISIAALFIVYAPHYNYPFPRHIDEWHNIEQSLKIGTALGKGTDFEYGFHIILFTLSKIVNLVLIYKFLPAIWATLSALTLFYVTYKTTNIFKIGVFAMIFFIFIKSNVNLGGLWFFTPLTFSIPFIFIYIYFFAEGIKRQNNKFTLISLLIMAFLVPIHSISVLFAVPFLTIYALINYKYILKEYKIFSLFVLIPLMGVIFYKIFSRVSYAQVIPNIIDALKFKYGWGVLELYNSPIQIYSLTAITLAVFGIFSIFLFVKEWKKFIMYLLWPVWVGFMLLFYKLTGYSYLSPYQRNVYYLVISLPLLSAIGLYYFIEIIKKMINNIYLSEKAKNIIKKILEIIIISAVIILTSRTYLYVENNIALYRLVDNNSYKLLIYLKNLPAGNVVASPNLAMATYAISLHQPIAAAFFNGNPQILADFYNSKTCAEKNSILEKYKAKYIISNSPIDCSWKEIFNKENYYLYKN